MGSENPGWIGTMKCVARSVHRSIVLFLALAAILLVSLVALADDTGPPVITFKSYGGYVSGTQSLEVHVDGDMASGEVKWSMDVDVDGAYQDMDDAGGFWAVILDTRTLTDGPHTLYVKALNGTGATAVASLELEVDNNSPSVEALTDHGTAWGDLVFVGEAADPYLNESAVYCLIDDDEAASKANVMSRKANRFEVTIDTTLIDDGAHLLRVWAFDLWGNSNKSNAISIFVSNRANLVFETVDWERTSVDAGDEAVAKVTVRNDGGTTAADFDVAIVEGDKVRASRKVTDPLGPGEARVVKVGWSLGEEGSREVTIRLDTGNSVDESNEDDNTWSGSVKLDFKGGIPVPGALLAAVAVASAGAVLVRRRGSR